MVTLKDVGKAAGVSTASVSKVLNGDYSKVSEETKERILKAAKTLKYRPNRIARGLAKSQTRIIGLLIPDISNPYYADLSKGVEEEAERNNYNLILCNSLDNNAKEYKYINMLIEYNVDGVILTSMMSFNEKSEKALMDFSIPYVTLDRAVPNSFISFFSNGQRGTYLATEYLIKLGHREIAFVGGEPENIVLGENQRVLGYQSALVAHNLPNPLHRIRSGKYTIDTGYQQTLALLQEDANITAIVCANDLVAFGAIKASRELDKRVPEDVSVTGYDDIVLSSFFEPRLTTIRQDSYILGKNICAELLSFIKEPYVDKLYRYVEPELVIRESVAPRL